MRKFKKCNLVAFVTVFVLTMVCCTSVYADDTSLGRTPEGVFPVNEKDVIMESEEITVDLEKNKVECIFVFHNTGKSKNVYMGFPGKLSHEEDGSGLTDAANLELKNFKTFVKGKELPVTYEKSTKNIDGETSGKLKYSEYYTFTVPFEAGEKVTVRNTYDFIPTYDSMGTVYSGYVLKTGAMWKDTIGSAKVTFKLGKIKPYQIEKLKPGGFKFVGNNIVWERTNFEPKYDLMIEYNTYHYNKEFLDNSDNGDTTGIRNKIENYNNIKKLGDKGKTEELLSLYNKAVKEKDTILALYISSFLPSDKISNKISYESSTLGEISVARFDDASTKYYTISCDVQGEEPADLERSITHIENGNKFLDAQGENGSSVRLEPGIEYTITYTLSDWNDHTEQKTLKCKITEQGEILTGDEVQASTTAVSSTSAESNSAESAIESANESSNTTVKENTVETTNESTNDKSNDLRNIVLAVLGVVLVGVLVVTVVIINKNKNNQA